MSMHLARWMLMGSTPGERVAGLPGLVLLEGELGEVERSRSARDVRSVLGPRPDRRERGGRVEQRDSGGADLVQRRVGVGAHVRVGLVAVGRVALDVGGSD